MFRLSSNNNLIIRNTAPPRWSSIDALNSPRNYYSRSRYIVYLRYHILKSRSCFGLANGNESWLWSDCTHIKYMRYSFIEFDGNIKQLTSNANVSLMPHSRSSYETRILYYYTFYVILWIFISTKNVFDTFPSSIWCCGKLMNVHKFNCIHRRLTWICQNRIYIYAHSFAISSACTI